MFEKNASHKFKRHAIGIIILGCFAMYFSCCLASDALNIIEPAFTEKMDWSFSSVSMPITAANYILIVLSFAFSTFILKNGTRLFGILSFSAMTMGTLLIGIAYSMNGGAYALYLIGAMLTKFAAQAVQMTCFQLCANWFQSTRGRILGIVTIAAPLNSATSITLLSIGTDTIGLTACYVIIAAILVIAVTMAYFFGIATPEELGMCPDGVEKSEEAVEVRKGAFQTKWSFGALFGKTETWALMIGYGIFNGAIGPIMGFFLVRMTEVGVEMPMALTIISTSSILGIFLSYIFGYLDDKLGTPIAARILGFTFIIACILFYFGSTDRMVLIWIAAIMMASIVGGTPNLHPSSIIYVFGAQEYQAANRYIQIGVSVISAFGVQLMSILLDKTGSLNMGYIVFTVLSVIGTACMFMLRNQYDKAGDL